MKLCVVDRTFGVCRSVGEFGDLNVQLKNWLRKMTEPTQVVAICILIVVLPIIVTLLYLRGRVSGRKEVIGVFQEIIHRLLHMAAEQRYKEMHLFLQDCVMTTNTKLEL